MKIDELRTHKRILILGYGAEGQATERFLKKFHPDAEIGIADQKDDPNYLDRQRDYDLAVRTPLLRPKHMTISYTTATNLFFANVPNTIIGVTGTKGKSTTVSLLHHVLMEAGIQSQLYGNIGKPMLDAVTNGIDPKDVFVLELSSYQLEDIHYSPQIGCLLNVYQELHNHDTYEEYLEAKSHIATFQKEGDYFFYNGSIPDVAHVVETAQATSHDFTQTSLDGIELQSISFLTHEDNLKAVWALAQHMGVSQEVFNTAIQSYEPLEHRVARVGIYGDITFYDDSASVHPHSTMFALSALQDVDTIILGGQNRGYSFVDLAHDLAQKGVQNIVLFPETGDLIEGELEKVPDYTPTLFHTSSMQEAVEYAFTHTPPGKIALLSPGAPSYLMYANLHERGLDFVSTIKDYAQKESSAKEGS